MTDLEELKKRLSKTCRRTTGHGEHCGPGLECEACEENKKALAAIERLQAENADLRKKLDYSEMAADAEARYADELKAKNDALKAERDDLRAKCNHIMQQHAERIDECGRLREDAERYRWLRDIGDATWRPFGIREGYNAAQADAAIDAAMQK